MAKEFFIKKQSGTYSETLETFGVANLLMEILERNKTKGYRITIKNLEHSYLVETNKDITQELIQDLSYFQIFKFIKKEENQEIPDGIIDYFDYPKQKAIQDENKRKYKEIEKIKPNDAQKHARKELRKKILSEYGVKVNAEFDVCREIKGNPYPSFTKLFRNFHENQNKFQKLINAILEYYSMQNLPQLDFKLIDEKPTAQQLYNPNQGKGLNKTKANNASMGNLNSYWISETMKISGAFSFMVCQYVKVGSTYDLKIYVPEFNEIGLSEASTLLLDFKKHLKSNSPIKLDILNSLDFTIKFIQHTPNYTGSARKTLRGFHSVYQKDLGQNKAVANISFINTPEFVNYTNQKEGHEWIDIMDQHRMLISNIEELGDAIQGLQNFRSFIGSTGDSALDYFADFSFWYVGHLMQQLSKGNKFIRTFKIEHLTKLYNNMDTKEINLKEIIENEGFKAVAQAIRKSTVTLQYTPKDQRKFGIRYGLAQQLQNKSKSKEDLSIFIGEFIGTYNAETARYAEKNGGKSIRANVKDVEQFQFYLLLDKNSSRLIGALLASYGFALNKKEVPDIEEQEKENTEENNQ